MARRRAQTLAAKDNIKPLLNPSTYTSLVYGALAVFVLFLIVVFGFRVLSNTDKGAVTEQGTKDISETVANVTSDTISTYIVREGDTLWSISEKYYKTGFEWKRIASENKIQIPSLILSGTKLRIPAIPKESSLVTSQTQPSFLGVSTEKIEGKVYTVKRGDTLWDIAVRAYGDGYKWGEIARVNKLNNPDLIHSGNKFVIPR